MTLELEGITNGRLETRLWNWKDPMDDLYWLVLWNSVCFSIGWESSSKLPNWLIFFRGFETTNHYKCQSKNGWTMIRCFSLQQAWSALGIRPISTIKKLDLADPLCISCAFNIFQHATAFPAIALTTFWYGWPSNTCSLQMNICKHPHLLFFEVAENSGCASGSATWD